MDSYINSMNTHDRGKWNPENLPKEENDCTDNVPDG